MIGAGLARVTKLLIGVAAASASIGLLIGLLAGAGAARSVSVGWYCSGTALLALGFLASSRGPTRAADTGAWAPLGVRSRSLRWATRAEQEQSLGLSAVLVILGVLLIGLGVAVDPLHPLF